MHRSLAGMYVKLGRIAEAGDELRTTADLFDEVGDRLERAHTQGTLAQLNHSIGEFDRALAHAEVARELYLHRAGDNHVDAAHAWDSLGSVPHRLGRHAEAVASFEQALASFRESGDRYEEASTLENPGAVYADTGDVAAAEGVWRRAAAILDDLAHPAAAKVRDRLANLPQKPTTPVTNAPGRL